MLALNLLVLESELLSFFDGDLFEPYTECRFPSLERDELGLGGTIAGPHVGVGLVCQGLRDQRPLGIPEAPILILQVLSALAVVQDCGIGSRPRDSLGLGQLVIHRA